MIKKYGLENRVFLKGATKNVAAVLKEGDIFAFPSAYEGFGLSLGEAMSMGLPAVGYRNCSAVNELIQDGRTGFLYTDNSIDFSQKLCILMEDRLLRAKMGSAARLSMKIYAPNIVWDSWNSLLHKVVHS